MPADPKSAPRPKPLSEKERQEMSKRFRDLIAEVDRELRAKGLSDAEREALVLDIMNEGKE